MAQNVAEEGRMVNSPPFRSLSGGVVRPPRVVRLFVLQSLTSAFPSRIAMRSARSAIAALSAFLLLAAVAACGGGESAVSDSAAASGPAATDGAATRAQATSSQAAAPEPGAGAIPGSPAPIVGSIIEVHMIGDARGYRFEPAQITAKPGDAVKFVVVSGGPHEVSFDLAAVPEASRQQLQFNMPNSTDGRSPLLVAPQEAYTVSLGGLAAGVYPFVSTPRLPQGMKGEIRIQ
jgi:plastocyanin